ncbi:hypothetical protein RFI_39163, partial [Reticulomyxa filosa]
ILKDNDIKIGYSMVKVEPFDKGKSRQKSHFKQCKKCYRLNHIVRECPKKSKVCKEKLGIKLTRKEGAFLKKKAFQHIPIKLNVQRQPKNYSYTDAAKGQELNGNKSKRANRKKSKRNNNDQRLQNKKSNDNEISSLKRELAGLSQHSSNYNSHCNN